MIKVSGSRAATAALILALTLALIGRGTVAGTAATTQTQALEPPCQQSRYGADGTMGPLFCVIDNPAAVSYFAPGARRTFALGPNATPAQVTYALVTDYKHGGTIPILCSIYRLAAWRNHWRFGISIVDSVGNELGFPARWCDEPSFSGFE